MFIAINQTRCDGGSDQGGTRGGESCGLTLDIH